MKFSERKGFAPARTELQVDSMSAELRASLWNVLHIVLWDTEGFTFRQYGTPQIIPLAEYLQFNHFERPIDELPDYGTRVLDYLREHFFACQWYTVYDFIVDICRYFRNVDPRAADRLEKFANRILTKHLAGYRFLQGEVVDVTDPVELESLEEALGDSTFPGVAAHLKAALKHLSNKDHPDYRNSMKESISAVEAMAQAVSGDPKATLGDALKVLGKNGKLHAALKTAYSSLYGYTNDADGIRHAMMDEPNLTAADAKYFLLSCTSFVNYLRSKL